MSKTVLSLSLALTISLGGCAGANSRSAPPPQPLFSRPSCPPVPDLPASWREGLAGALERAAQRLEPQDAKILNEAMAHWAKARADARDCAKGGRHGA